MSFPQVRPRRLRRSEAIRSLVRETTLHPQDLIAPLFLIEGSRRQEPIESMPDIFRFSIDLAIQEVREWIKLGIQTVMLFCAIPIEKRNSQASEAIKRGNLLTQGVEALKNAYPHLTVITDVALDPFTDHGHDGLLAADHSVDNDLTLPILEEMACLAAEAGVDFVAPSDMMDGRIGRIRRALDQKGYSQTGILSYAIKYASSLYGPFREALDSAPKFGNKLGYQMDPANRKEAMKEIQLDIQEGADLLLVKPATWYLDIISDVRAHSVLPVGGYHVSGEYSMIMAAASKGWLNEERALYEALLSIKRAGADFIVTYGAKKVAKWLQMKEDK